MKPKYYILILTLAIVIVGIYFYISAGTNTEQNTNTNNVRTYPTSSDSDIIFYPINKNAIKKYSKLLTNYLNSYGK